MRNGATLWSKSRHILVGLILAGLLAWTSSQTWWRFNLTESKPADVHGVAAAPALLAFTMALLALNVALALSGRIAALVLSVFELLFGMCSLLQIWIACIDPLVSAKPVLAEHTGVSGIVVLRSMVTNLTWTPFVTFTVIVSVLLIAHSIVGLITASRFKVPRGYRREQPDKPIDTSDSSGMWDAISSGVDPTGADPTTGQTTR